MSLADKVNKAAKLIDNAAERLDTAPYKAREGLELAERLMDEGLLEWGMSRYNPSNPCALKFERVYECWRYLNGRNMYENH